jgi:hypothetical protein
MSTLPPLPEPVITEQEAFECWLDEIGPSGDVTEVQCQWEASHALKTWIDSVKWAKQITEYGQLCRVELEAENQALRKALDDDLKDRVALANRVIELEAAAKLALDALLTCPRETREVWKDGIAIDVPSPKTKYRDGAIEALRKAGIK